ncbi:hypothetical protein CARUB_v10002062mg [Capsella rubella]|uniref:PAR1 protein n=1 Tax=Capsella rubella TaxID=81985 RepID=R0GXL5_9BRAS|nr:uncharacterized protein LOC17882861 [Capsella rubella]EOA21644.1 hypothetical protein CARUB_v10002062mg [Capsella rubella]
MVSVSKACLLMFITFCSFTSSHANVICEDIPDDMCSFSISALGKRCVLETEVRQTGGINYRCRSSEVDVDVTLANYIETDECVNACGVDRRSVGISSDALLEPGFAVKLCTPECLEDCPNIADLYSNLVAAEGSFLPDLCAARRNNPHRSMFEILSSGASLGSFPGELSESPTDAPAYSPVAI